MIGRLCGCITKVAPDRLPELLRFPHVDMAEWRLDNFLRMNGRESTDRAIDLLSSLPRRLPVIATVRPTWEGGEYDGPEPRRLTLLQKAATAGAEWVDVEDEVHEEELAGFAGARIVLSRHDFAGTPDSATLRRTLERMARKKTHAAKIVTTAQSPEDCLRVLDLIPFGKKEFDLDVTAFCMGPLGGWSRIVCLLMGSPWSYVRIPGLSEAAPGQFTSEEARAAVDALLPFAKELKP